MLLLLVDITGRTVAEQADPSASCEKFAPKTSIIMHLNFSFEGQIFMHKRDKLVV